MARKQGSIRKRGQSYQVRVYAGIDPVTGKENYLTESTADEKAAERVMRRLLTQVDNKRSARTKATFGDALDAWLKVHEADESTIDGYAMVVRLYIKPRLGKVSIGKVTAQMLEGLYADLRRCRGLCDGRPFVEHRIDGEHECRAVRHRYPPGRPPAGGHVDHDCAKAHCAVTECPPHVCRPLAQATIRKVHFTISAALSAAVRWDWIASNVADVARQPRQPAPEPDPPSPADAARIIAAAWDQDDDWGTLVWLVMVTGMRRAEALALRWFRVDFDGSVLDIRRNYVWVKGRGIEKDTKTHQMRRIALDPETVDVLRVHRLRHDQLADSLGAELGNQAYLFSPEPDGGRPYNPDWVSHRYTAMCAALGIDSHLHALRHYSATELLTAGVDLRTVAGRLGHSGGGTTTLRIYAAWVSESDKRAAAILGSRMKRPNTTAS
jgi:integrase